MSSKTLVERHGGQVIYKADTDVEIPDLDILTLLFGMFSFPLSRSFLLILD